MSKNRINRTPYKSYNNQKPFKVIKQKDNKEYSLHEINILIKKDIKFINDYVEWCLHNDKNIREDVINSNTTQRNTLARELGIHLNDNIISASVSGSSGTSRYDFLFQDRLIREAKSWAERSIVKYYLNKEKNNSLLEANDKRKKKNYVNSGWKRTADDQAPSDLSLKYSLSTTDKQFCKIINDPFKDNIIIMSMVIDGDWFTLYFHFNKKRFNGGKKICLPDVRIINDKTVFNFSIEYEYHYSELSSKYIIGVDVGCRKYATAVVWDTEINDIVHVYSMSRRACSLQNSINATTRQVHDLQKRNRKEEAALHRSANSRKKRELAILVAQEIAHVSHIFDNAMIAVEDLSWIKNTMQNGRWNRGELIHWL